MIRADGVVGLYCVYVNIAMFRNLTKGSFLVDVENISIEIYHLENSSVTVVK